MTDSALLGLWDDLADQLKLAQRPTIVPAKFDGSPFVCGVRSPVLVLPRGVADELDLDQFRQVLAHELAHVRRRDLVWGWIAETARMLYFFHPVAHWVSYRVRLERELACDEIAMHLSGFDAGSYAETLVQVASRASESSLLKAAANASAGLNGTGTLSQKSHHPQKEQLQ